MIDDPEAPDVGIFAVGNTAHWRVWASRAKAVDLVLDPLGRAERVAMRSIGHGYFEATTAAPEERARYGYSLDGGPWLPDPASRWQPDGVNQPSAHDTPTHFTWTDQAWSGVPRPDLVFYELHVGTFTREGTFEAIITRLDELKELGITAIELMPVAEFAGTRSWGYDGVHPFAAHHAYGGPTGLRQLVDACHARGLAVFLDVVYNHFGPEGRVLTEFGDYLTEAYKTAWGPALNFDGPGSDAVRAFVCQNLRSWVRDYHIDGFRFDAADQIFDRSPRHILSDLADVVHAEALRLGRPIAVFAETDLNDSRRFLLPADRGGYGFDGHWNDDFHHAVHAALTGESGGYYVDFSDAPAAVAKTLEHVFVNNGNYSTFRNRRHGAPVGDLGWDRFVGFVQNHDQVGNRAKSDRHAAFLPPAGCRLGAGLLLLAPRLPLLFMGEEYGETAPFPFFCDYSDPSLVEAVRKGRREEFAHFGWDEEPPDPFAPATRDAAVISWDWSSDDRRSRRALHARLIALRRELTALRDPAPPRVRRLGEGPSARLLEVVRGSDGKPEQQISVVYNLGPDPSPLPAEFAGRPVILRSADEAWSGQSPPAEPLLGWEFVVLGQKPA